MYKDALHRYTYAMKKYPDEKQTTLLYQEEGQDVHKTNSLIDLKFNLYLYISRTQKKLNKFYDAIETCTNGLSLLDANTNVQVNGTKYQFYYLRARSKKEIK
jgi:hypothetical protein